MNIKKFFHLTLPLVALPITAQTVVPSNDVIDCGQVIYQEPVTVQFELVNEGETSVSISDVQTSCGCTTVNYPQGMISRNKPFVITAEYDAKQLGHFEKYIDVYTSGSNEPIMLTLRGVVVAERKGYEGNYSFAIGRLKTDREELEYDDVNRGERPVQEIHILNSSSDMATPTFMHLPPYLKAEVSPSTLAPGQAAVAKLTLESRELREFGLTQTSIYLGQFPGDRIGPEKEIVVSTILLPDFSHLTENQLANAPQIQVSTYNLDLGRFDGKKKKKGTIEIENVGRTPLDIRSLQMFTRGLRLELGSQRLKPGESTKLKVTAERKEIMSTRSKPRILMITNDPSSPKVVINVNIE
jgi:hypothetical protein